MSTFSISSTVMTKVYLDFDKGHYKAYTAGLQIVTNTVALETQISGEVVNLRLVFTFALSTHKG